MFMLCFIYKCFILYLSNSIFLFWGGYLRELVAGVHGPLGELPRELRHLVEVLHQPEKQTEWGRRLVIGGGWGFGGSDELKGRAVGVCVFLTL